MALAMEKATITMKAANISFSSSAKDMSEYLTAIWNSYQVGADELERYVDIMANLGAHTATSMEEISTALRKVAATANNVGVDMEQMSSIIATSASVTRQSAEIIGTAWNTILSRIGGLKLGETLEDGVDLNKYSKALASVGVQVLDASGNLRDMGSVIDEIGEKWGTMSKAQQSALAQTIGGTRQYTQMMAFFDNYDTYEVNLKFAEDSEGTLQKQQDIWAESAEAAAGRVKNAWQNIYSSLLDDKGLVQMTNVFADLINGIGGVIDAMGGLIPVIGLVASAFLSKLGQSGQVSQSLEKLKDNFAVITGKGSTAQSRLLNDSATRQEQLSKQSTDLYTKNMYTGNAEYARAKATMVSRKGGMTEAQAAKLDRTKEMYDMQNQELANEKAKWDAAKK